MRVYVSVVREETQMPCELNEPRCPIWEQRGPSWMFGVSDWVKGLHSMEDGSQILPMGYSALVRGEESYDLSRHGIERTVQYIYAYVTIRDVYDKKFCMLLAIAFILNVCMLVLVLILVYRRRFLDKKYL